MQENNYQVRMISAAVREHNLYVHRPLGIKGMLHLARKTNPQKIDFARHNCGDGFKGKIIVKKKIILKGYNGTRTIKRNVRFCQFCGAEC
jgi:hypothetical protein